MSDRDPRNLFFIVAPGRSGTSLLRDVMATFPGFCTALESRLPGPVGRDGPSCWTAVRRDGDFADLERFIDAQWTDRCFVEKTPDSILCLPQLAERYPSANVVFLERHPRRILLSQLNLFPSGGAADHKRQYDVDNLIVEPAELDLPTEQFAARRLLRMIESQVRERHRFARQITVRYEDLVADPRGEVQRIGDAFDVAVDLAVACEKLAVRPRSSRQNRYDQVDLTDPEAARLVAEACRLWRYSADSAPAR